MNAVLEPGHLRHKLIALSDTSPQRFRLLIWDPHFGKKPTGMQLGKHAGVDLVRSYLSPGRSESPRTCERFAVDPTTDMD